MPLEVAVLIFIGRASAVRMLSITRAELNVVETQRSGVLEVHANHREAMARLVTDTAEAAVRLVGVAFYNAVSFAMVNHHHLPTRTKKFAKTTQTMCGIDDLVARVPNAEGYIMHDMFHPLT